MRRFGLPVMLAVVVGACGGSAATTAPEANTAPEVTTAPAEASEAPPASEAAVTEAPAAPPAGGGGGSSEGVCGLASADELSGILGVSVTTMLLEGPPDTCDIQADGAPIASMTLTLEELGVDPALIFQAMTLAPGLTDVSGVGDKAVFDESGETLIVLKGDSLLVVAVYPGLASLEERQDMMKQIGALAAGRM